MTLNIGICGGGVGGLTAAIALARQATTSPCTSRPAPSPGSAPT
jgi:hypothetical protein